MILHLIPLLTSCPCPKVNETFITVEIMSVEGIVFGFNENGIFPKFEEISRQEVGLSIRPDSTEETMSQIQMNFSFINPLYACQNPERIEYVDLIDSIQVYTMYDFDENHQEGSSVMDILLSMDINGNTSKFDPNDAFFDKYFKFNEVPTNDSLQMRVTGSISNGEHFDFLTNKIYFKD